MFSSGNDPEVALGWRRFFRNASFERRRRRAQAAQNDVRPVGRLLDPHESHLGAFRVVLRLREERVEVVAGARFPFSP